jgi:hypothetical protein
MSTCYGGCEFFFSIATFAPQGEGPSSSHSFFALTAYTIGPLQPGYSYVGPETPSEYDPCKCSTVVYSLISACDACQGAQWITYDFNIVLSPLSSTAYNMSLPLGGLNTHTIVQKLLSRR